MTRSTRIATLVASTVFLSCLPVISNGQRAEDAAARMAAKAPVDLPKDMKAIYSTPDRADEDLKAHGIGTAEDELIRFLKEGLPHTTNLPQRPPEKSQLLIDAMVKLARLKSEAAVPVLMQIARFDTSLGAFRVIEFDVSKTSQQGREDFRVRAYRLIQYNAVTALGVIGDPRARELIRSIMQQETAPGAQIQYAICLATLGDPSGVDGLIHLINQQNRRESAAAAKAFYYITGQDFGYSENTPVRMRQSLPARYSQWWTQNRSTFRPDPSAIDERREAPERLTVYTARSTRDLLKLAAIYFDFNNTLGSAAAREKIHQAGSSLNNEFKRIATDPMEDLDVRMEAMNWYFEANRSDPLEILKDLRKDENPEIADKANTILQQIAEENAKQ